MRKVLIFGATGTIGAYAAVHLKGLGYSIIASGKRETDNGFFLDYGIEYLPADITDRSDLSKFDGLNIDAIIHCAGMMPAKMEGYEPQKYIDSIIIGTHNILELTRKNNVPKIIFTQTRADSTYLMGTKTPVSSDIERRFPLMGDHAVYAICKNAAVDFIEHYFHQHGLSRFVLRLPTIYAYHPDPYFYVDGKKKMMAYRYMIERASNGDKIELWGDPNMEKEIVSVRDLCQIFEKCVESPLPGGIYNVGRGEGVTLEEQVKGIISVFGRSNNKSVIEYRPDMPNSRQFIHDISKTKEQLGYEPRYDYISLLLDFKKEMEEERFSKLWGKMKDYGTVIG
ncbi:NAD-dependent epimerase/dehydratase family protein [Parapedobacter sp. 10938]|uniref:NAD-dependent epimerase/dehydratase family protein n=1 Tax=Parapedobacter flavus TaxID=3110225 RepID=UPI002DBF23F7|nr:NAD(P)-dependent oxidoreductase [Parapedobacter sp. 10938]MEC3880160.1 NAD(P)-dependent oxidoreductase [Parapedobacter sp. 10938]